MSKLNTYKDYTKKSYIFESFYTKNLKDEDIKLGEKLYEQIVKDLQYKNYQSIDDILKSIKRQNINEGIFTGLLAGGASALVGPAIMKAIIKVLGIQENGPLGKLLTSSLVLGAMGYELGK